MAYLAEIALGPVQGFIAAGRNTRDLAFGSWMLQDMARHTASELQRYGFDLIFPTDPDRASTNKLMAVAPVALNAEQVTNTLNDIERSVRTYVQKNARAELSKHKGINVDTALWQINDVIEFYWGFIEFTDRGYAQAVVDVQRVVAARKNSRLFNNNQYAGLIPKSSLTGTYESVIDQNLYPTVTDKLYQRFKKLEDLLDKFGVVGVEQLSGIDVLKRKAQPGNFIPVSTAAIAARGVALRLSDTKRNQFDGFWRHIFGRGFFESPSEFQELLVLGVDDILERYCVYAVEGFTGASTNDVNRVWQPIDAQIRKQAGQEFDKSAFIACVYPAVRDVYLAQHSDAEKSQIEAAITAFMQQFSVDNYFNNYEMRQDDARHLAIAAYIRAQNITTYPYFAVIAADGDRMGSTIASIAGHSQNAHKAFSDALWSYASDVKRIAMKYFGNAIYAGGDDFLIFVPVTNALSCAAELNAQFTTVCSAALAGLGITIPTLSTGVVVAHYQDSLNETMRHAREAEKQAKSKRDAVSIRIAKRSGSERNATRPSADIQYIQSLAELWRTKKIPHGFPYEIQSYLERYFGGIIPDNLGGPTDADVLKLEIKRIASRKQADISVVEQTVGANATAKRWYEWSEDVLVASEF